MSVVLEEAPAVAPAPTAPDDHVIVLFGATGDLARRKLPGMFHLAEAGLMPERFVVIGVSRSELDDGEFVALAHEAVSECGRAPVSADSWSGSPPRSGSPPSARASRPWPRRSHGPGGISAETHGCSTTCLCPIFRIDHYLGREAVQNLLAMRFANGMFEPVWNRDHIDHIQIDVPETLSIGIRASFYEQTGAFRDMIVTHLFQVLGFVAMEPPTSLLTVAFNMPPRRMFPVDTSHFADSFGCDHLTFELGDPGSISATFLAKVPGPTLRLGQAHMHFSYSDSFGGPEQALDAYERLIHDVMVGHRTFSRPRKRSSASGRCQNPSCANHPPSSSTSPACHARRRQEQLRGERRVLPDHRAQAIRQLTSIRTARVSSVRRTRPPGPGRRTSSVPASPGCCAPGAPVR